MSRKTSRRTFATILFSVSIFGGMQLALHAHGQSLPNAQPMPLSSINQDPPAPPPQFQPANQPSVQPGVQPIAPTQPQPVPQTQGQVPQVQKGQAPENPAQGNNQAPPQPKMIPIMMPGAVNMINFDEEPTPTPKKKDEFVPSAVETFIPTPARIGDPRAILHTSKGDIRIRLYSYGAPANLRNFIDLARGDKDFIDVRTTKRTRRPFYNNLVFHRVLEGYLIQTGCPFGNGHGGPGYVMPDEINPMRHFDKPGIVAMAPQRTGTKFDKDSNGSQFFITLRPMPAWDGMFTIIGEVERGLNVARAISKVKTGPTERPIRRVFLKSVEILDEASAKAMPHVESDDSP